MTLESGTFRSARLRLAWGLALAAFTLASCSVIQTRPVQEMSDTAAALRAAKEVQADVLAPELFRQAADWYTSARSEYRLKNFYDAKEFADKARRYAEQAEYEAIRGGATRSDSSPPPPPDAEAKPEPYDYPEPTGTPAAAYEEMMRQQAQEKEPTPKPT